MGDPDPATAARERLLLDEEDTVDAVLAAADAVAIDAGDPETDWFRLEDGRPATSDRDAVVSQLREELSERGLLHELTGLLATAVDAAGYNLSAQPVPAPPYVAVTSTGPVLRAAVEDGRLVVTIHCFEVVRRDHSMGTNVAYARTNTDPASALSVSLEG